MVPAMWNQLRAVAVTLHILAIVLHSFPAPVGLSEAALAERNMQAAFESWAGAGRAVGWTDLQGGDIEEFARVYGAKMLEVRATILAPFGPYYTYAGTRQRWQMFGYINQSPARFQIELEEDDAWRTLYTPGSPVYTWRRSFLDQERIRALVSPYSWGRGRKSYNRFGTWLARQAAAEFPEATRLRTVMVRVRLPPADELRQLGALPVIREDWDRKYALKALR